MTTSDPAQRPDRAYVWVWLPDTAEPVVAGRLDDRGAIVTFTYARSYLERAEPMAPTSAHSPARVARPPKQWPSDPTGTA